MQTRLSTRANAFGLALLVTLSLMAGIHQLATSPAPEGLLAQQAQTSARS